MVRVRVRKAALRSWRVVIWVRVRDVRIYESGSRFE